MQKNIKKEYNAPQMDVMNARVERGYTSSGNLGLDESQAKQNKLEGRKNVGNWGGGEPLWN